MKRKLKCLLTLSLSVLTLVGCSTAANQNDVSYGGDAKVSNEIVFWHCLGQNKLRNLTKIIDEFNKAHKDTDGYVVKAEALAGDYNTLTEQVNTKLQAGFVPSFTMGYPDAFATYIGKKGEARSKIMKLDDLAKDDSNFNKDDFDPAYYNEGTGYQYEGLWSVPLYKSTEAMYINKEMFEGTTFYKENKDNSYGDNGSKIGDPKTWDWNTLVHVGEEVEKELKTAANPDFVAIGYDSDSNLFISQMAMRNIPYTTKNVEEGHDNFLFVDGIGKNATPKKEMVDLAEEIFTLTQNQVLCTQGSYGNYASDLFKQQKVMITIGSTAGSSYNDPIQQGSNFHCGLYPVPQYGPESNAKYIQQGPSLCFFDSGNTSKNKATWEFYTKYLADVESNARLALDNSYDPVKNASYEIQYYKDWMKQGQTDDGKDDIESTLTYRIPNLTADIKKNGPKNQYITTDVFLGSSTARTEVGNIIKYAQGYKDGTNRDKVTKAIKAAYDNCAKALL